MICAFFNLKTTHKKLNLEESYERIFSPKNKMESHTTNPWYVVGDKRTTASPAHSLSPAFYLRTSGGAKVQVTGHRSGHRSGYRSQARSQVRPQATGQITGHTQKQ